MGKLIINNKSDKKECFFCYNMADFIIKMDKADNDNKSESIHLCSKHLMEIYHYIDENIR